MRTTVYTSLIFVLSNALKGICGGFIFVLILCSAVISPVICVCQLNLDSLYNQALRKQDVGKFKNAIQDYDVIIEKRPRDTLTYFNRAISLHGIQDYIEAIKDLDKVVELNASFKQAYLKRALYKSDLGLTDEAIIDLTKAIKIDPTYEYAYVNRGVAYTSQRKFSEAKDNFTVAIKLNPTDKDAWYNRAMVKNFQGSDLDAIKDYDKAIELDPNMKDAYNNRGLAESNLGLYEKAIDDFSTTIKIAPNDAIAYNNRGLARNNLGQYDSSISDFNKSIDMDSSDGYPVINVISPLVRIGDYPSAINHYNYYLSHHLTSFLSERSWKFYNCFISAINLIVKGSPVADILDSLKTARLLYKYPDTFYENKGYMNRAYTDVLVIEGLILTKAKEFEGALKVFRQALIFSPYQPDVTRVMDSIKNIFNKQEFAIKWISLTSDTLLVHRGTKDSIRIIGMINGIIKPKNITINDVAVNRINEDNSFEFNFLPRDGFNAINIKFQDDIGNYLSRSLGLFGYESNSSLPKASTSVIGEYDKSLPRFKAILIAEQNYVDSINLPRLHSPLKNAREFYNLLVTYYGYSVANIDTFYNKSRDEIIQGIINDANIFGDSAKGYDDLLIFYSGHGHATQISPDEYKGYIIPTSARGGMVSTYISSTDISDALATCNTRHILFIADACFSGALMKSGQPDKLIGPDAPVFVNRLFNYNSRKY